VLVTITGPGTAVIGDPAAHSAVTVTYTSIRDLNRQITAAGHDTLHLAGAARCPACPPAVGLFAVVTLVYRRGSQPVACAAALCDSCAQREAARITSYCWPHVLLDGLLPARYRAYDLASPGDVTDLTAHLAAWPDVSAILTAGTLPALPPPAGHAVVPEPAGAVT
jgi:hypothetical protein